MYVIQIHTSMNTWQITKRYSEILKLHDYVTIPYSLDQKEVLQRKRTDWTYQEEQIGCEWLRRRLTYRALETNTIAGSYVHVSDCCEYQVVVWISTKGDSESSDFCCAKMKENAVGFFELSCTMD